MLFYENFNSGLGVKSVSMENVLRIILDRWPNKLKQIITLSIALFGLKDSPLTYKIALVAIVFILDNLLFETSGCSKKLLDSICQNVYYSLAKDKNLKDIRVSILIARRFLGFGARILEVSGRFTHGEGKDYSLIYFKQGCGVAGICLALNQVYKEDLLPDSTANRQQYLKNCQEKYKLSWLQLLLLNRKARSYICFPIEYFDKKGKVAAVLSIDSDTPGIFSQKSFMDKQKNLEKEISTLKVVFLNKT
jgi:hypothetical protein